MKAFLKNRAPLICLTLSTLVTTACPGGSDPVTPPAVTPEKISLTLLRNGKAVVGSQTIIQKEGTTAAEQVEIGSGLSDAQGKIQSNAFTGSAIVTVVDAYDPSLNYLFTLRGIKAGATLDINLPLLNVVSVGTIEIMPPADFPGAEYYQIYTLGSARADQQYVSAPFAASPISMNIKEDAVLPNGKITIVAVAYATVPLPGTGARPIAYAFLKDVAFAPTGLTPSALSLPAWQSNLVDIAVRIPSIPTGFDSAGANASLEQFVMGTSLALFSFNNPVSFATPPLDFDLRLIPGLADQYSITATLQDTTNKSLYATIRRTPTVPSLTSWNPEASGLPRVSGIAIDPSVTDLSAPRLMWNQTTSAAGIADMALIGTHWNSAGRSFAWYTLAPVESIDETNSYQHPHLPAAYSAYVPADGTLFDQGIMLLGDYSTYDDYDAFLKEENLRVLQFKLKPGSTVTLDLSGTTGTP